MCGITGGVWTDPQRALAASTLAQMTERLRHRGPDDDGSYRSEWRSQAPYAAMPGVALGFRRLSIIDLAGGHQPMANEDDSVWIVFNGEVYNFGDLRRRLEGSGHRFRTQSDTESIVHLYEDEGVDAFRHLNGMFAIAIWDARQRRLVLARDRLGKKPLVYCHEPGRLLFASELKSLLAVPDVRRDIDPAALDEYLTYQYVPHPNTIWRGIRKLPPGHYAVFQDDRLTVRPYWQPDFTAEPPCRAADAIEQVRELFSSSVRLRLRSDVPLGCFLSGGVDSSLVAAMMTRELGRGVRTFSIGFSEAAYDETRYARLVAEHLGTEHHEFRVTADALDILPRLVWHYDEPFADSSAVPTWYVSQRTREQVTVALSGDGGDELFAGYARYRAVAASARLDRFGPLRRLLAARVWQRLPGTQPHSFLRRVKRFSEALSWPPQRRYLEWIGIFNEARRAELYRDDFVAQLDSDPLAFLTASWNRARGRDAVTAASLADLTTYLPCDLMTKVDIASMAHGLECRQPFLDYRLVEFAAGLPTGLKLHRGRSKRLLRLAFEDLLPREIWTRPKMGFGVPLTTWFRQELRPLLNDTLLAGDARVNAFLRSEVLARMATEHASGTVDHGYRLWTLLVLELWLREWHG